MTIVTGQKTAHDVLVQGAVDEFRKLWKKRERPKLREFLDQFKDQNEAIRRRLAGELVKCDLKARWRLWQKHQEKLRMTGTGNHDLASSSDTANRTGAPTIENYLSMCPELGGREQISLDLADFEMRTRQSAGDTTATLDQYTERFPHLSQLLRGGSEATLADTGFGSSPAGDSSFASADSHSPAASDSRSSGTLVNALGDLPDIGDESLSSDPSEVGTMQETDEDRERRRKRRKGDVPETLGRYKIIEEIARGAMGVVYKAIQPGIDRIVAVKAILSGKFANQREIDLFLTEAQIAGNLEHDHVVTIYEAGRDNDQHFIAMKFVNGRSLDKIVREKPLPPKKAAEMTQVIAETLHFAHTRPRPVFHRDIKPANVLVDENEKPYLTDFGIAKRVESEESQAEVAGGVVGTPSYMPPEQAQGMNVDARSDVYSTGAMLYHLLVGKPPFAKGSVIATLRQVMEEDPVPPTAHNSDIDGDLEAICLKCLEKDPKKRYPTAQALADDIGNFLHHRPTVARPPSMLARFGKWRRRNPGIALLTMITAFLLLLLATGGTGAAFVFNEQKNEVELQKNEILQKKEKIEAQQSEIEQQRDRALKAEEVAVENEKIAKTNEKKAKDSEAVAVMEKTKAIDAAEKERLAKIAADAAKLEAIKNKEIAEEQRVKADASAKKAIEEERKARAAEVLARKAESLARQEEAKAIQNFETALAAIERMLVQVADKDLANVPGMDAVRQKLAEDAISKLAELQKNGFGETIIARETLARTFVIQGDLQRLKGSTFNKEALIEYRRGRDKYEELAADRTLKPDAVARYLALSISAAKESALVVDTAEQELKTLQEAQEKVADLLAQHPQNVDVLRTAEAVFTSLATSELFAGLALAQSHFEQAGKHIETLIELATKSDATLGGRVTLNDLKQRQALNLNNRAAALAQLKPEESKEVMRLLKEALVVQNALEADLNTRGIRSRELEANKFNTLLNLAQECSYQNSESGYQDALKFSGNALAACEETIRNFGATPANRQRYFAANLLHRQSEWALLFFKKASKDRQADLAKEIRRDANAAAEFLASQTGDQVELLRVVYQWQHFAGDALSAVGTTGETAEACTQAKAALKTYDRLVSTKQATSEDQEEAKKVRDLIKDVCK